jgi:tetratricopeptide (TPR) repeat protein
MNNQNPRAAFERTVELLKGGARQEAEALCRDMLERDPGDINFVSLLGSILASRGAHEEAVSLLSRAVKAAPGHAKAQEDLGTLLLNLDRAEEALSHLERAQELRPPHAALLSKLSAAHQRLGRSGKADELRRDAASLSPTQAKLDEATRLFVKGPISGVRKAGAGTGARQPTRCERGAVARAVGDDGELLRRCPKKFLKKSSKHNQGLWLPGMIWVPC